MADAALLTNNRAQKRPDPVQSMPASAHRRHDESEQRPGHGGEGDRTPDLLNAIQALSQLSYAPAAAVVDTAGHSSAPHKTIADRNQKNYSRVYHGSRRNCCKKARRALFSNSFLSPERSGASRARRAAEFPKAAVARQHPEAAR